MRTPARSLLAAVAVLSLVGCGSASEPSPPSGVDGLVIPTPSPDPADFADLDDLTDLDDNPWFPLRPGTRWEYDDASDAAAGLVVQAEIGPEVAGVATVSLVGTGADGTVTRDHYARDRAGNVWWFGRDGVWSAGVDGAEAGLAMPADPRVGDGFRRALVPGAEALVTVEQLGEGIAVPLGVYDDTLVLQVEDGTGSRREVHVRGIGLVKTNSAGLVGFDEPR